MRCFSFGSEVVEKPVEEAAERNRQSWGRNAETRHGLYIYLQIKINYPRSVTKHVRLTSDALCGKADKSN